MRRGGWLVVVDSRARLRMAPRGVLRDDARRTRMFESRRRRKAIARMTRVLARYGRSFREVR